MVRAVVPSTGPRPRRPRQAKADPAPPPLPVPPPPPSPSKTAVVVIHGMGEQVPLETLRGFVETVYRRDRVLASMPVGDTGLLDVSIVPDDVTGSAELRRITTLKDGPAKRTDFFEFYWADIMDGTPVDMVIGWIRMLVLRSPLRLPQAIKVRWAWGLLSAVTLLIAGAGVLTLYPGLASWLEMQGWVQRLGADLQAGRPVLSGLLFVLAAVVLVMRAITAIRDGKRVSPILPLALAAAGLVVSVVPPVVAGSLQFWAGAITLFFGWALNGMIAPYVGDVARYVRATPSTVERRRQVHARGMALLEALHSRRLNGPPVKAFTQAAETDPPLYDRIVIVAHSLGTIIAYDLLQLFWEKYGPTHHQDWGADDAEIQAALEACDLHVRQVWNKPRGSLDMAGFTAARDRLFALLRQRRPGWRISDFITMGSPLAHAEFLLVDNADAVDAACEERRFATAPPRPDPIQKSMLYGVAMPGLDGFGTRQRQIVLPKYPHFAAQFSTVRWTNIYDESHNPLLGDLISGRLEARFGPGIVEHPVAIRRPGWMPVLRRLFTHTRYWAWHDSYEPSPANVEAADAMLADEALQDSEHLDRERRSLLWHNVPEHIRLLREALRLGT